MTTSFTTTRLVNERALVRGTDVFGTEGETVVSTQQWDEISQMSECDKAAEAFDNAVRDFFAPLERAAEAANRHIEEHKPQDASSYVVVSEAVEGVEAQPRHLIQLNRDSVILRLIEEDNVDRLVWVDGDLEVLEAEHSPTAQQAQVYVANDANVGAGDSVSPVEGSESVSSTELGGEG